MLFAEPYARTLLIVHAILGAALVAVSTHLVVWTRRCPRGEAPRLAGVRWFAVVGLGLYAAQFTLGNVIYPVYKVRVRGEYLDRRAAVAADATGRQAMRAPGDAPVGAPRDYAPEARAFDIKEHVAALGLPFSAAILALAFAWDPRKHGATSGKLLFACAAGAALCTWVPALVGLWVTSYRSIGGM